MIDQGERADHISGTMTDSGHVLYARIYYADTDFSGFVYHARYLEFLERGRSDYLRLTGISHTALAATEKPLVWVVRRMEIQFLLPAKMDDVITIETVTDEISGARIVMAQTIRRGAERLILAKVEAAVVNPEGKPRRFPKEWAMKLKPVLTF